MSIVDIYARMRPVVNKWVRLDDDQWSRFSAIFRPRSVPAGNHILHVGDKKQSIYFISSGLIRLYYLSPDGKESNKAFGTEGMLGGPLVAAILGLPSHYGIEALEDTELLVAPVEDFTALYDEDPAFDRIGRRILEQSLVRKELRERSFLQQSATERYLEFVEKRPDLVQRIAQYHIASYLGITEVSLSRLKRELVPNGAGS
jgi:CRP-like cAMP-binding protein